MRTMKPAAIERRSMEIIETELSARGIVLPPDRDNVVKRVIHATADFDFAENLRFTPGAAARGINALRRGGVVVTDTNMALAGVSRPALEKLGGQAVCYMAEPSVGDEARRRGVTRAAVSMERALADFPAAVTAVGNAPTALLALADLIEAGAAPSLVVGVPVGFVNVTESKERLWRVCTAHGVPAIVSMGRKGGSGVAAAICNALLYEAAGLLDPAAR